MSSSDRSDRIRAGRHAAGRAESPESTAGDPALRRLQQSIGNEGMKAQLHQGNTDRSTMLAHVVDRLSVMEQLQHRELNLLERGSQHEWWRDVARDQSGAVTTPDPNRWHEAAEAYKDASDALCRGDLDRGHQLLERAMEIDDRTVDRMTTLVNLTDLESDARPDSGMLDGLVAIGQLDPCDPPEGMEIADKIVSTQVEVPEIPRLNRVRVPWWALEEEEEEGDGGDGGGGDGAGGS